MATSTRDALLDHGALLFASRGLRGVTARDIHLAAGAKNESALHYHFGGVTGLLDAILRLHVERVEQRREILVAELLAGSTPPPVRDLLRVMAAPMAEDLGTAVGRAHLRIVALVESPSQMYEEPFVRAAARLGASAPAGARVAAWLRDVVRPLPPRLRAERLATLRVMLVGGFGARALLVDETPELLHHAAHRVFVENLLDVLEAMLNVAPSAHTAASLREAARRATT